MCVYRFSHYLLSTTLFLLLLGGCSSQPSLYSVLDEARVMMRYSPSDALKHLRAHQDEADSSPRETRMRYYMLMAQVAYMNDETMPSDTLLQQVVDYFNKEGSANEQMNANYVMGLKYLRARLAPEAMQYFYIATDKVSDTDPTCDFETLMEIYGQMSQIFHYQDMYENEVSANRSYSSIADRLGFTYESIMGQERNIEATLAMGDTAAALEQIEQASRMYRDNGYDEQAAATQMYAIPIYIDRRQYDAARSTMQLVEQHSGLFASDGSIQPGHELYYGTKARYYLAIGHTDSATIYFDRLLHAGYDLSACRGLLDIYRRQHPDDYISRLFSRYITASDQQDRRQANQDIHKLSYLYNYQRFQQIADKRAAEAERTRLTTTIIGIIILLLVAGAVVWFVSYRRRQRSRQQALQHILDEQYRRSTQYQADRQREINDAEAALQAMTDENRQLKDMVEAERLKAEEQQRTVDEQKHMLDIHMRQLQLDQERQNVAESHFFDSGIYSLLRQHLSAETILPADQWTILEQRILQVYPTFHDKLYSLYQFSETEYRICLLTKIKVSPTNMALLMATSKSSISQNRSRMYRKVFHKAGSPEDWDDFIMSID